VDAGWSAGADHQPKTLSPPRRLAVLADARQPRTKCTTLAECSRSLPPFQAPQKPDAPATANGIRLAPCGIFLRGANNDGVLDTIYRLPIYHGGGGAGSGNADTWYCYVSRHHQHHPALPRQQEESRAGDG
jgi:hypothetical protein